MWRIESALMLRPRMTSRRRAARRGSESGPWGSWSSRSRTRESRIATAALELTLSPGEGNTQQIVWEQTPQGIVAKSGDRLLVVLDVSKLGPAEIRLDGAKVTVSGQLPPGGTAEGVAYVPAWPATPADAAGSAEVRPVLPRVAALLDPDARTGHQD